MDTLNPSHSPLKGSASGKFAHSPNKQVAQLLVIGLYAITRVQYLPQRMPSPVSGEGLQARRCSRDLSQSVLQIAAHVPCRLHETAES